MCWITRSRRHRFGKSGRARFRNTRDTRVMVTKPMPRTPKRCRLKLENHLRFRTCWARGVLYVQYAGGGYDILRETGSRVIYIYIYTFLLDLLTTRRRTFNGC